MVQLQGTARLSAAEAWGPGGGEGWACVCVHVCVCVCVWSDVSCDKTVSVTDE